MSRNYFERVSAQTQTKLWVNNVTPEEAIKGINVGATGSTQNPSYVWKMINNPNKKSRVDSLILKYKSKFTDAREILIHVQSELVNEIAEIFLPLYKSSHGKHGYVSIQGDPFDESSEEIIRQAHINREKYPNIMVKVPAVPDGYKAISKLAFEGIPINATEIMTVRQAIEVCETYNTAIVNSGTKAPICYSHITGILDEYLQNYVKENRIEINPDYLWQAGMFAAKKTYKICKDLNNEVFFVGGGARGLHHFTDMVGSDSCITINWQGSADKLLEQNPKVIRHFDIPIDNFAVEELLNKISIYKKIYNSKEIEPEEYHDFGPVAYFRKSFEESWQNAHEYIKEML